MRRREFISLLGGAAAWPLAARAQQGERMLATDGCLGFGAMRQGRPPFVEVIFGGLILGGVALALYLAVHSLAIGLRLASPMPNFDQWFFVLLDLFRYLDRHRYARCCRPAGVEGHITCKGIASEAGRSQV